MPSAIYRCNGCGSEVEAVWSGPDAPVEREERICEECEAVTEFQRQWRAVGVGRVKGAGDSPARKGYVPR